MSVGQANDTDVHKSLRPLDWVCGMVNQNRLQIGARVGQSSGESKKREVMMMQPRRRGTGKAATKKNKKKTKRRVDPIPAEAKPEAVELRLSVVTFRFGATTPGCLSREPSLRRA